MTTPTITLDLLQALGIKPETIREQVVDAIVTRAMGGYIKGDDYDDEYDGYAHDGYAHPSQLAKHVHAHVDKVAAKRFAEVIEPITEQMIDAVDFPSTNQYGEPKGPTLTLREHIAERAKTYLSEQVDSNGRARWEGGDSYGGGRPRIVHLIHAHLKYSIDSAVEQMMREANKSMAGGVEKAIKGALENIVANFKVSTTVKA